MERTPRPARWLGAALLALVGCGGRPGGPGNGATNPPAPAEPLRIAAASDLQAALPELAAAFRKATGIEVVFTPGASGQLAQQVRQGAPFDLLLAANRQFVTDLAKDGAIRPESVRSYALGSLVLAVSAKAEAKVESLADLARPEVKRVALANPWFAPYGAAGKQSLESAHLWEQVEPKVVYAETVRQALRFVQSGEADAGLVGRAIADVPEVRTVRIDPSLYDPIVQGLGITNLSAQPERAEQFARFLLGDDGQAILARFGFGRPRPPNVR